MEHVRLGDARRVHVTAESRHPRLAGTRAGYAALCGSGLGYVNQRRLTEDPVTCPACLLLLERPACGHEAWGADGHCAVMVCEGYVNKCPRHATAGKSDATCNRA